MPHRHIALAAAAAAASAALRHTSNPAQAQDITQAVFIILARKAAGLGRKTVLAGWLYHTARLTAANWQRSETRRIRREQEAFMQSTFNESAPDDALWRRELSPMLDDAMGRLGKTDRDALVLRYFQNRNLAEVGVALGIEERTAQKRVSRALEKLRKIFTKRGVALSATAIAGAVSANAVTAAPVALAEAVAAGALSGTTITNAAVIAATKTIAMTTLQKTIVTIAIAALAGVGIYEARQAHDARAALQKLQQQQAPLAEQIRQLQNDRGNSTNQLADLLAENSHLKSSSNQNELLKLRGQVGVLRAQASQQAKLEREPSIADITNSSPMQEMLKSSVAASFDKVYGKLIADLKLSPDQVSSLKQLLSDKLTAGLAEKGTMMIRKMSPEQIQQLNDQINTEKAGVDERIKQTLGADGFAAYQAYEKTYNERSQIVGTMGFSDQLTGSMELTSDQTEQLVQAMSDERQQYKFTVDYSDPGKYSGDMATLYSAENISQYQKELEQLHQLYLARAQTILTPDQQTVFQKYLSNRLAMQNMGLNMTAKIVGGKSGDK